jgi:hypothetical protein
VREENRRVFGRVFIGGRGTTRLHGKLAFNLRMVYIYQEAIW